MPIATWLVQARSICQANVMNQRRSPAAGGIFLFLGPILGTVVGLGRGEAILGMLYGFAAGIALTLIVWAIDRRRR